MWDLATIVALNDKAHQEYLKKEGITEEEWRRRAQERCCCIEHVDEQRILMSPM